MSFCSIRHEQTFHEPTCSSIGGLVYSNLTGESRSSSAVADGCFKTVIESDDMSTCSPLRVWIFAFAGLLCGLQSTVLFGHFLFIRVGEHAEAGRAAEVFFSERAEAGDPRFIGKVAGTQLWMQHEPGKFIALKTHLAADRLRANLPTEGAVSVTGLCEYGILEREVPFLLRYYPKAISGPMDEVNQLKANDKSRLEIVATVRQDSITLVLLDDGKAVPNAVFTTVDDALVNEELKADGEGRVTWKPASPGHYCVYTKVVRNTVGEFAGKKYTEIREFPTLAFQWPLGRADGDKDAVELFEKAIAARATWRGFPGFSAQIQGDYDGRPFSGTVQVDKEGTVELTIDQDVAGTWIEGQMRSLVQHRLESPRPNKPVLRFADQDLQNPLGRLLTYVGGQFASSYRVKDDQLKTVNRNLGSENMTITVLDNEKTAEGKYLPHLYTVQYWDAAGGDLLRTETFENHWHRTGGFDLPTVNTVVTSSAAGLSVRSFRLSQHQLRTAN